jgi:hypothetical protein
MPINKHNGMTIPQQSHRLDDPGIQILIPGKSKSSTLIKGVKVGSEVSQPSGHREFFRCGQSDRGVNVATPYNSDLQNVLLALRSLLNCGYAWRKTV